MNMQDLKAEQEKARNFNNSIDAIFVFIGMVCLVMVVLYVTDLDIIYVDEGGDVAVCDVQGVIYQANHPKCIKAFTGRWKRDGKYRWDGVCNENGICTWNKAHPVYGDDEYKEKEKK